MKAHGHLGVALTRESRGIRRCRVLQPAPVRAASYPPPREPTCFYDLPAELRVEIYKLAVRDVTIHILPAGATERACPLPLALTSRQVRNEVLPIVHSLCALRATVTDFDFEGLLGWIARIPPDQHANLSRNDDLQIVLCTSLKPENKSNMLRRWLHLRADPHRAQPNWQYSGPVPKDKVANELRRRVKRMKTEPRKQAELLAMMDAIGVFSP